MADFDPPDPGLPTPAVEPSADAIVERVTVLLDTKLGDLERRLAAAPDRPAPPPPPGPPQAELLAAVGDLLRPELTARLEQLQDAVAKVTERVNAGMAIRTPLTEDALAAWFHAQGRAVIEQSRAAERPPAADAGRLFERLLRLGWTDEVLTGVPNRVVLAACAWGVASAFREAAADQSAVRTVTGGGRSTADPSDRPVAVSGVASPRPDRDLTVAHVLDYPAQTARILEHLPWQDPHWRSSLLIWLQHRLLGQSVEELAGVSGEDAEVVREHIKLIEPFAKQTATPS